MKPTRTIFEIKSQPACLTQHSRLRFSRFAKAILPAIRFVPYNRQAFTHVKATDDMTMALELLFQTRLREAAEKSAISAFEEQVRRRNAGIFQRDPTAEQAIIKHWPTAYRYCKELLRGPWAEFERSMTAAPASSNTSDARAAFNYARYIVEDRMEKIEKHIAPDAMAALDYAKEVLGRPWNRTDQHCDTAARSITQHPTAQRSYQMEMPSSKGLTTLKLAR
jgi:hypothetical protein